MESKDRLVLGLTMEQANDLGLVKCICGHAMNMHYRPTNSWYCCFCTCGEPFQNGFTKGTEIEVVEDQDEPTA